MNTPTKPPGCPGPRFKLVCSPREVLSGWLGVLCYAIGCFQWFVMHDNGAAAVWIGIGCYLNVGSAPTRIVEAKP